MVNEVSMPRHQLVIPNTILVNDTLSCIEKMVISELIWLQDYGERCKLQQFSYANNYYLARVCNVSKRTISDTIKNLVQKGFLHVRVYASGNIRRLTYDKQKCFERDIALNLKK